MEYLLLAVAELLLLAAGFGTLLLITPPDRNLRVAEALGLSILLGAGVVSLASFCLGLFLSGAILWLSVTAVCLIMLAAGLATRRSQLRKILTPRWSVRAFLITVVLALQAGVFGWLTMGAPLGWDGLVVWDMKARAISVNRGAIPIDYFSDPSRHWSQPDYPLFLPLNESWIYTWLGHPSQGLGKFLTLMFYVAAVCFLYLGAARFGGWLKGLIAALLVFAIPVVVVGDGSASSGYADFPLGVYYLAAVVYLLDYWDSDSIGSLRLVGSLAAILPWIKQEGIFLWLCLMAFVVLRAVQRRTIRPLVVLIPGVVIFGGWRIFLSVVNAKVGGAFLPFSLKTFWSNLGRIPGIAQAVLSEMMDLNHWSFLWAGIALSLLLLPIIRRRQESVLLLCSVLMPVILYSSIYIFSAWNPFVVHINTSLSRLLIQLSLVALLAIVLTLPIRKVSAPSQSTRAMDHASTP